MVMTKELKNKVELKVIGIRDVLDIPEAHLANVPCKTDTGAYNCSIDCSYLSIDEVEGIPTLTFKLLDPKSKQYKDYTLSTSDYKKKKVKSSNGVVEYRYQVKLTITLLGESYRALFNLSKRHNMRFPILLGRKFLSKRFLVDVSKKDLSAKNASTLP
jgi:hypothetical protein